jgi:proline iminopeptidase
VVGAESGAGVLNWDGIGFSYVREGSGPPIVVIGSSVFYSRAFSPALRRHFEMVFVDSRHFIPSYLPSQEERAGLTMETFADDVEALRAHLGIERWAVLGHSVHAQIALAYAKYPRRTSHLAMVAGMPYSWAELEPLFEEFWEENASPERKACHAANRRAMEEATAAAPEGRKDVLEYVANAAYYWVDPTYDSTWLWEGVEFGPAYDSLSACVPSRVGAREILETIDTPTLVVLGELDYAIPHVAWEEIIEGLPNVTYVLMDAAGHNPQTEAAERLDRVLVGWLTRH